MGLGRHDDVDEVLGPDPESEFLSTAQAAALLGASSNFIIGEIRDGRLPALVIERPNVRTMYRIRKSALDDYVKRFGWTPPRPA